MKRPHFIHVMFILGILMMGSIATPTKANTPLCSGADCNGKDVYEQNCAGNIRTVYLRDVVLERPAPNPIRIVARVELRWSETCKTNWAKASIREYSTANWPVMEVDLRRADSQRIYGQGWTTYFKTTGSAVYGDMYYAPNEPVKACLRMEYGGDTTGGLEQNCTTLG